MRGVVARFPWLTFGMLCLFCGVFYLEQVFAVTPGVGWSPSVPTLIAMGGTNSSMIMGGQWWRPLTATFLHASASHVISNCMAFALAGYALETSLGRAWTFVVFMLGALAGWLVSTFWLSAATVCVGASGGIMAMLAATLLISFRMPAGRLRYIAQFEALRIVVPAMIPIGSASSLSASTAPTHVVDHGAHLGGIACGVVLGVFLLWSWRVGRTGPAFRRPATALAAAFALLVLVAGAFDASAYAFGHRLRPAVTLVVRPLPPIVRRIPPMAIPTSAEEMARRAPALLIAYPDDPVAHFYAGATLLQKGDAAGGERALRAALTLAVANPSGVSPQMAGDIRAYLALLLNAEHRDAEAVMVAEPACRDAGPVVPSVHLALRLRQVRLCP